MPKFPTYERSVGLGGGATASYASDGAFAAPGRALAGLGATVANLGETLGAEQEKIRNTQDEAWFSKARAQTATDMITAEQEAQKAATGEAGTYISDVGERFNTYRGQKLAEAPTPRAQQLYNQWADSFSIGVTERASKFQAQSELTKRTSDFAEAMNAHSQAIYADPDQYDSVYKRAMDDFEGARKWMTPEQETKARETVDRNLKLARAKSLAKFAPDTFLNETGRPRIGGASGDIVDRIIGAESNGNPNAQNTRSSAGGAGQFIDSTWVGMIRKHRPDLAAGASNDDIIAMKTDGALSREMVGRLTEENSVGLRKAGFEASDRNLYLAHFAGLEGAKALLSADDSAPVSSVASKASMDSNPHMKGKTVGDVKAWADRKVGASGSAKSDFPIVTKGNSLTGRRFAPDIDGVQTAVISRFKYLQNTFGASIPVVSGFRDQKRNEVAGGAKQSQHISGNALDLDVSDLSREKRIELIKQARAAGFGGIGVYGNSLHIDTGPVRAWGPSHYKDSIPGWAKEALDTPVGSPDVNAGATAGASFANDPRYAGLSIDEIMALQNDATKTVATRDSTQYASLKDQLEIGIATGQITGENQILGSGLNGGDQATLLGKLRTAQEEGRNLTEAWTAFKDGSLSLDSYDGKAKTLVDRMERSLMQDSGATGGSTGGAAPVGATVGGSTGAMGGTASPGVVGGAAEQPTGGLGRSIRSIWADEMVRRTGIVPIGTVSEINRGLESGKVQEVAAAASRAARIQQIDPAALGKRDNGSKAADAATAFTHYVDTVGMSEEQAAQRIIDQRDPEKVAARKSLMDSEPAKKFLKDKASEAAVRDIFDPGVFGFDPQLGENPRQSAAMVGEYRSILEESLFDANGDVDLAKTYADQRFALRYAPSSFTLAGENIITRLPPERTYPAGQDGTHDYVRQQAIEALKAEGVETDKVFLQSDENTDADWRAKKPARYRLFYEKDGAVEMFNLPFFAIPPAGAGLSGNKAKWEENKAQLEAGRDREKSLDNFLDGNPLTGGN